MPFINFKSLTWGRRAKIFLQSRVIPNTYTGVRVVARLISACEKVWNYASSISLSPRIHDVFIGFVILNEIMRFTSKYRKSCAISSVRFFTEMRIHVKITAISWQMRDFSRVLSGLQCRIMPRFLQVAINVTRMADDTTKLDYISQ